MELCATPLKLGCTSLFERDGGQCAEKSFGLNLMNCLDLHRNVMFTIPPPLMGGK